jgi:hypothetical protein
MNYQEFVQRVQHNMHETIYEDSEGRSILIIDLLDAFAFANKLIEIEREACAKVCEDSVEYAGHTLAQAIRARGQA